MAERYQSLTQTMVTREGEEIAVWEGWLQPLRTQRELDFILDDLHENQPVAINQDSELLHDHRCRRQHTRPSLRPFIKRADRCFRVRIEYEGGRCHPRAYLFDPVITLATRKHVLGQRGICAHSPWEDAWKWDTNTVADFTDLVLIWLVKWNVWVDTGIWLGPEKDHEPLFLFATIGPSQQCWCGSGLAYDLCHRAKDKLEAESEIRAMLARHSPLLQKSRLDTRALRHLTNILGTT